MRTGKAQAEAKESEGTLWLEVEISPKDKRSIQLKEGENVVGRTPPCDIPIEDGSISRKHAVITVKGGLATIKDLGSKNHTFFDNQRVNYEIELRTQTPITFGLVKAILVRKALTKG
jgi:pSer/pThr/pTyr-binding forkhead associated (FHA) protein